MLLRRIIEEYNLYEGLDVTHNVETSVDILNSWWNMGGTVYFEERNTKIKMAVLKTIKKEDIDGIRQWANNLGYFPSSQSIRCENKKFDYEQIISALEVGFPFDIFFDPKYDPEVAEKELPAAAYHITPSSKEEKILRIGLAPRSKEKISKHPERIYFAGSIEDAELLSKRKDFAGNNTLFTIFGFDLKELKKRRKIRYFSDPRYGKGFYTYENIPPQYLKVVKRIRTD